MSNKKQDFLIKLIHMHPQAIKLLSKINEKLKDRPLFYFSRDIERGLGLENLLDNYFLISIEDSYVIDRLNAIVPRAFSLNKEKIHLKANTTQELINHPKTLEWIINISKGSEFYAQLFQFNQPALFKLEKLGGKVLNNHSNLNRKFEDKLSQYEVLKNNNISIPQSEIKTLEEQTLMDFLEQTSLNIKRVQKRPLFIVQLSRAHTGSGTFFIKNNDDWEILISKYKGNIVKISEYIEGESYTINVCITKKGTFIAGLQYQITGIPELTVSEGSTVGNDFSYANNLSQELKNQIFDVTNKISEIMRNDGYRGLFGLDIVIMDNRVYIIEINARQTANMPFQTKLEIDQNRIPLSLINLAEWMNIDIEFEPFEEILTLEGSQVFLRSKEDNFIISEDIKSGIYRLQSDNAVKLAKDEDVILLDEDGDKPLIWQREGYSIEEIKGGGFILLIQRKGTKKDKYDELARMQFRNQIMIKQYNNLIVSPWVLEAMNEIRERLA